MVEGQLGVPGGSGPPHPLRRIFAPSEAADRAIADLYAAHWQRLVRLAWLLLRDQLAAEDVVQDAFVATHRHWSSIRDSGRVVGYLQTAVVNGCRSVQRHSIVVDRENAREAAAAGATGLGVHASAEAEVIGADERDTMMRTLAGLPRRQREVLVLRYYADLSEAQIAQALEISVGSVKAHAHRGLAALRSSMPAHPDGSRPVSRAAGPTRPAARPTTSRLNGWNQPRDTEQS